MSSLLLDETPLIVIPRLAQAVGLNEAIVLQQLHWLLQGEHNGKMIANQRWIFNTVEQWRAQYFRFWSVRTIKTIFSNLSRMKLIETCQPEGRISRRKYYRVNVEEVTRISDRAKFVPSMVQRTSHGNGQNSSLPITETSSETSFQRKSEETKETAEVSAALGSEEFVAKGVFDSRTKKEKLDAIRRPRRSDYPTQREFDAFIESEELDEILSGKRDQDGIYNALVRDKWRTWSGTHWNKIRDWKAYVRGLNSRISDATAS